ncbi:MAG: VOC family protein [Cyanobacteria bacterium P01_D01_bin.105]
MHFHHLHFYVKDAAFWQNWFIDKLAFQAIAHPSNGQAANGQTAGFRALKQGDIEVRLSDPYSSTEAQQYLQSHPPGIVDVAWATDCFEAVLTRARAKGAKLIQKVRGKLGQRQCQFQGWGSLRHTLVEIPPLLEVPSKASRLEAAGLDAAPINATSQELSFPLEAQPELDNNAKRQSTCLDQSLLSSIDHVVLNVCRGQMEIASNWYQQVFGFTQGQRFEITTAHSGLCSQVLVHPNGSLQLPINEPSSANSQVQEFLDHNRGSGIQHVALRSSDAVSAIAHFRQKGLNLISVPTTYYEDLQRRPHCPIPDTRAASAQQLLVDWAAGGQQGALLQTFTKPIFSEPTFFFEIIERGTYAENGHIKNAQGFGEGNFQALFEAIERDQLERGSLEAGKD